MAWRARWASLLACTVARAVASSFLELPQASGADGETPALHEVERDLAVSSVELPRNCVRPLDFCFEDSSLNCSSGQKKKKCAEVDGAALAAARRRKERTYPELVGDSQRAGCACWGDWRTFLRGDTHVCPSPHKGEDPWSPILDVQMGVSSGLCRCQGVCVFVAGSSGPLGSRWHHPVGC